MAQLEENLAAPDHGTFSNEELAAIDREAVGSGINTWPASSAG